MDNTSSRSVWGMVMGWGWRKLGHSWPQSPEGAETRSEVPPPKGLQDGWKLAWTLLATTGTASNVPGDGYEALGTVTRWGQSLLHGGSGSGGPGCSFLTSPKPEPPPGGQGQLCCSCPKPRSCKEDRNEPCVCCVLSSLLPFSDTTWSKRDILGSGWQSPVRQ